MIYIFVTLRVNLNRVTVSEVSDMMYFRTCLLKACLNLQPTGAEVFNLRMSSYSVTKHFVSSAEDLVTDFGSSERLFFLNFCQRFCHTEQS